MEKDGNTPETDEELKDSELEHADGVQGDDPLDSIEDAEALRAEAKKFRAIAKRKAKTDKPLETVAKGDETKVVPTSAFDSQYVTRKDLERVATRDAKKIVGDEIMAEYDELIKIPLAGYDPLDAESIASNLRERYSIYKSRNPDEHKGDVSGLTATKVAVGTGKGVEAKDKPTIKDPPNFVKPKQPDSWYPIPNQE